MGHDRGLRVYLRSCRHVQRWRILSFATIYTIVVVYLQQSGHKWVDTPVAIPAMLGTVLSVLLGFCTASAYERWWEARKVWGAIVNDSRTFARQVLILIANNDGDAPSALQKKLVYQIAWPYALMAISRTIEINLRQQLGETDYQSRWPQWMVFSCSFETRGKLDRDAVPSFLC